MKEDHKSGGTNSLENPGASIYRSDSNGPPLISCFKPPIYASVPKPFKDDTLKAIYQAISGDNFKQVTLDANREYKDCGSKSWPDAKGKERNPFRIIKESKLCYVTFGGTFKQRANNCLIEQSWYYCFDLDHLKNLQEERERILKIKDEYFTTNLLFTSPSGVGLKWIISIKPNDYSYTKNYKGLQQYLKIAHNIKETDKTSDVSRPCFLCHDPNAYFNEDV